MNQSGNQQLTPLNLPQSVNPPLLSVLPPPIVILNHLNPAMVMNKAPTSNPDVNKPNRVSKSQVSQSYSNWRPQTQNFPKSSLPSGNWRDQKNTTAALRSEISNPAPGGVLNSAPRRTGGRSRRSSSGYKTKALHKLQSQNPFKVHTKHHRRKFHKKNAPFAPRNTSSFIIRAKKSGGIAPLISPYPVTPAVLPTPIFSPSKEVLGDMAKEEWGVDGYGSMKGLIRLRYAGHEADGFEEDEEEEDGEGDGVCSSESDVEEHVEVERRLDQDLSRFEMVYPDYRVEYDDISEKMMMDDQNSQIEQLEVENMRLKERLLLMTRDLTNLTQRLHFLEGENITPVDNCSDNDSCHRGEDPQTAV